MAIGKHARAVLVSVHIDGCCSKGLLGLVGEVLGELAQFIDVGLFFIRDVGLGHLRLRLVLGPVLARTELFSVGFLLSDEATIDKGCAGTGGS